MPIIEVKALEQRFQDEDSAQRLITALTDALVAVYGENSRAETWVILEGVSPKHWGFGGRPRL